MSQQQEQKDTLLPHLALEKAAEELRKEENGSSSSPVKWIRAMPRAAAKPLARWLEHEVYHAQQDPPVQAPFLDFAREINEAVREAERRLT